VSPSLTHTFSDFDENGLLYWIGCNEGRSRYSYHNPSDDPDKVNLSLSHTMFQRDMKKHDVIGRSNSITYWGGACPQYFILDLVDFQIFLTHFTIRHGYHLANSYVQDFKLEGSKDGKTWNLIFKQRETPFKGPYDTHTFQVPDGKDFFRFWKFTQKGHYSLGPGRVGGSPYLCISGFEVYGAVCYDSE